MKKLASLPVWQQMLVGAVLLFPWVAYWLVSTDILPQAWRFNQWPEGIRLISSLLFLVFIVAELLFSIRWFMINVRGK
jgi:hypothetical protein